MNTEVTSHQLTDNRSLHWTAASQKRADNNVRYTFDTLDLYHETSLVLGYLPQKTEINSIPIMREALHAGKRLALPWFDPKTGAITFFEVTSISNTRSDTHGLKTPPREAKPLDTSDLRNSICLVPSVVFDGSSYTWAQDMAAYEQFLATYAGESIALVRGDITNMDTDVTCDLPLDVVVGEQDFVLVGAQ